MCGKNRKRPAAENEDDTIAADTGSGWPQAVFLPNLQQPKASNAALLLQDVRLGEPVLVYTGTKPPAPGAQAAIEKKNTVAAKPTAAKDMPAGAAGPSGEGAAAKPKPKPPAPKDAAKDGAASTAAAGDGAAKPKPKKPAPPKEATKDGSKDGAAPAAAAGDAPAPKPKPKKPKPAPTDLTPAVEKTSHVQ
jgi:D-alanyl-D-alanine carboxypeptidase